MTFAAPIGQVADIPCGYAVERSAYWLEIMTILAVGVPSKITCMKIKET